jgi:hypothetical protein
VSRIRRLRPWARWLDRDVRAARARHLETLQFQIVDYTDSGVAVKMPVDLVPQWEAMPAEVRAQFLADVDQQHFDDELHEWRPS